MIAGKIRFKKIKVDKTGRVILEYDEIFENDRVNEYTMKCVDQPRPEFKEALKALRYHLAEICELSTTEHELDKIEIRGLSLSWTDEIMGAVITGLKALARSNSPLVLNTPHLPSEPYSETGDESMCLTSKCVDDIDTLIQEAELYLQGDRQQLGLFSESEENGEDGEDLKETVEKDLEKEGIPISE